jgi:hypothetical protein
MINLFSFSRMVYFILSVMECAQLSENGVVEFCAIAAAATTTHTAATTKEADCGG